VAFVIPQPEILLNQDYPGLVIQAEQQLQLQLQNLWVELRGSGVRGQGKLLPQLPSALLSSLAPGFIRAEGRKKVVPRHKTS